MTLEKVTILNVLNKGHPIKPPCLTEVRFLISKKSKPFFEIYKNFRLFISASYFTVFPFFSLSLFFFNVSAKNIYSLEAIDFSRRTKNEKLKAVCIRQQKNNRLQQKNILIKHNIIDW